MSVARPEAPSARPVSEPAQSIPWPSVIHDVRGAATAIEALAALVAAETPGLPPASRGLLDLIQARAEQLGTLCEAVALLQGRSSARLPLSEILPAATRRLQKFLDRGPIGLKFVGEIPDTEVEARPLAVLIQSVLVTAVNARDASGPAAITLEVHVVKGTARIAIELAGPGWGRAAGDALAALGADDPADGPVAVAASTARRALGAALTVEQPLGSWRVALSIPVTQPLALVSEERA